MRNAIYKIIRFVSSIDFKPYILTINYGYGIIPEIKLFIGFDLIYDYVLKFIYIADIEIKNEDRCITVNINRSKLNRYIPRLRYCKSTFIKKCLIIYYIRKYILEENK